VKKNRKLAYAHITFTLKASAYH